MNFETQLNDFYSHQAALEASVNKGEKQFVYIDPDGTFDDWIVVVIVSKTGVVYGTQCGGTANEQRYLEGFLIPCGSLPFNIDDGRITSDILTSPFHDSRGCLWNRWDETVSETVLAEIIKNVQQVTLWHHTNVHNCTRDCLEVDLDRVYEIREAWIPVKTKFGRGVLLWNNCD